MKRAILAKLGLGTAQFGQAYGLSNTGGQVAAAEAGAILKLAAEAGMRVVDTAPDYGDAEILLGQAMTPSSPLQVTTRTISIAAGVDAVEAQAGGQRGQLFGRPAGRQQRRQRHVSGDARDAVEVRVLHARPPAPTLMRCAA